MKLINTIIICSAVVTSLFSSCNNDEDDPTRYATAYVTNLGQDATNRYTFVCDGGLIVHPSATSVASLTPKDSTKMVSFERACIYFSYDQNDLIVGNNENSVSEIKNIEIMNFYKYYVYPILSSKDSLCGVVTRPDSLTAIYSVENAWAGNGYMNFVYNAPFNSQQRPVITFITERVQDNQAEIRMCYNLHKASIESKNSFFANCRLDQLEAEVPGNDSIAITIHFTGCNNLNFKLDRKDMKSILKR